jgi:hypothetical protein
VFAGSGRVVYGRQVRARWVLGITIILMFMAEAGSPYAKMIAPFAWVQETLFESLPWKIRPFDHIVMACWFFGARSADGRGPRVKPMKTAMTLSALSIAIWFIYGVETGGDAYDASWQTYLPMSGILMTFALTACFRTPEHWTLFAKMLLFAAGYRAVMCWLYYFLYVRSMGADAPEYITSHDDTVLWVTCLLMLLLYVAESTNGASRTKAMLFFFFLFGAVLFNQRRIAWVSLAMGLVLMYALLQRGRAKRRYNRAAFVLVPIIAIYATVGWGREEKIFKPLHAFATVSTEEDNSTKARNMENLGLVATSMQGGLFMGTGWGHPYVEVSNHYSIATIFKMWQYFPHNSVLGMLGFTGVFGFFTYWIPFPTAMFLHARMARTTKDPVIRQGAILGATTLVACANQYYGDMGIVYPRAVYMLAMSYAIAMRLPLLSGAWPGGKRVPPKDAPDIGVEASAA